MDTSNAHLLGCWAMSSVRFPHLPEAERYRI
jgi:hypothetical protein